MTAWQDKQANLPVSDARPMGRPSTYSREMAATLGLDMRLTSFDRIGDMV